MKLMQMKYFFEFEKKIRNYVSKFPIRVAKKLQLSKKNRKSLKITLLYKRIVV